MFKIDFLLNNSGSLRAKVFNKENEYQFFGDEIGFTQEWVFHMMLNLIVSQS